MFNQHGGLEPFQAYCSWLQNSSLVDKTDDGFIIVTPYVGPDGDCLEVYVHPIENGKRGIELSDGGWSLDYLFLSGIDISQSGSRAALLRSIVNNYGVEISPSDELYLRLDAGTDVGEPMARLIQAMLSVQHLIYTARPSGIKIFRDEVAHFMTQKQIEYSSDYIVKGRTRDHKFDFAVMRQELKLIRTLSTTNSIYARQLAVTTAFSYIDIKNNDLTFQGISIIDDSTDVWSGEPEKILTEYSTYLIHWSDKEALIDLLAA